MDSEHKIVRKVIRAKKDSNAADRFIKECEPFIRAEVKKFLNRAPVDGNDDELSIGMIAFYEAITSYVSTKGAFFPYAALIIKSRLIDHSRKENKHRDVLLILSGDEKDQITDSLTDNKDYAEETALREATKTEIKELCEQMQKFGVTLSDVAENCPKRQKTLEACKNALVYAKENPEIFDELFKTNRLPLAKLSKGSGVERKTLERHRKYLIALFLIYTKGFEIIRGHLKYVLKGGDKK